MSETEQATYPGIPDEPPSQRFFANLAAEMRKPAFGDHARDIYAALLVRAQESGLYTPEPR